MLETSMEYKNYDSILCSSCLDTIICQYKYLYQKVNGDIVGFFCSEECVKIHEHYTEDCIIFTERF